MAGFRVTNISRIVALPDQFSDVLPLEAVNALLDEVLVDFGDQQVEDLKRLLTQLPLILSIQTHVKSIEIGEIRESQLSVTANYTLNNRS